MSEYDYITAKIVKVHGGAALLDVGGDEDWVPLSLFEDEPGIDDEGETMDVGVQRWKLEELGWA